MIRFVLIILLYIGILSFAFPQRVPRNRYVYLVYRQGKYLELSSNKVLLDLKRGIPDGKYMAFYDKKFRDSALVAIVVNGMVQGEQRRFDKKEKYLWDRCEYHDGKMNGLRFTYVKINGVIFENITRYEDDVLVETIKTEY